MARWGTQTGDSPQKLAWVHRTRDCVSHKVESEDWQLRLYVHDKYAHTEINTMKIYKIKVKRGVDQEFRL